MGFVTRVTEVARAERNGETLTGAVELSSGAEYVSSSVVIATPTGPLDTPTSPSQNARVTWLGPATITSESPTPPVAAIRVTVVDVAEGEAVWLTLTEYQP